MKNSIRGFRRLIQQLEVEAASKVDEIFGSYLIVKKSGDRIDLVNKIKREMERSFKSGLKFGKFIRELTIEVRERREIKEAGNAKGRKVTDIKMTLKNEKEIFREKVRHEIREFNHVMSMQSKKMRARGMDRENIELYFKSDTFILHFQGFLNKVKRDTADFIAAVSNVGYYRGLYG